MTEITKEILTVLVRIITILPILLFITIFMGKRSIGELPVFDYLIIITLGSVTGADIADHNVKQLPTIVAIIAIGILQRIVANFKISNRKFGKLITFEPTVVIQDGKFINKNLKKDLYSIDNILNMLREKDIFDISDVETAIIESNGSLSVLRKSEKHFATLEDIGVTKKSSSIAFPIIMEGTIYSNVLKKFNLNETWLYQQLSLQGINDIKDIFFASLNSNLQLHISLKNDIGIIIPPIKN
ncbi:DUF421 domain-containing protein [Tepidibacter mesophilus]|uniref:DUF421 domain-containing protein n=1 Tax=Tepidibacter mesophilus TaxID=655607 RepID=UPI000C06F811|nr:DUF421 domain-containing protein [Tepidibacter mesophilus]